jgi:hypothetical protein
MTPYKPYCISNKRGGDSFSIINMSIFHTIWSSVNTYLKYLFEPIMVSAEVKAKVDKWIAENKVFVAAKSYCPYVMTMDIWILEFCC